MLGFKDNIITRFFVFLFLMLLFVLILFSVGRCKWRDFKAQNAMNFPQESLLQCKSKLKARLGPMQSPSIGVGGFRDTNPPTAPPAAGHGSAGQRPDYSTTSPSRLRGQRAWPFPGLLEQSLLGNVVRVAQALPTGKWLGRVGEGVDAREMKGKRAAGVWAGVPRAKTPLSFGFGFGSGD